MENIKPHKANPALPAPTADDGPRSLYDMDFIQKLLGDDADHPIIRLGEAYLTALNDPRDPDSAVMRDAVHVAQRLRAMAKDKAIRLDGPRWIAPQRLSPHAAQLHETFNRLSLSENYLGWQRARTRKLVAALCEQKIFREMMADWHRTPPGQQAGNATWISRKQQEIFCDGIVAPCAVEISTFSTARPAGGTLARMVRGSHSRPGIGRREPHDIRVNVHPDSGFNVAAAAMDVVHHENDHAIQWALAESYALGRLPRDHALAREARLFLMAFEARTAYVAGVRPAYRAHPLEIDTFAQSGRFVAALRKRLHTHGIDIDYNPDARPVALLPAPAAQARV